MTMNDYQNEARKFRSQTATWDYAVFNLAGEVGEYCSLVAKAIRDGFKPNHRDLGLKELGDILWHVAAIADDMGCTLEDVAKINIEKLESRAQRGKLGGSGDER